jgi:hypothetical protein
MKRMSMLLSVLVVFMMGSVAVGAKNAKPTGNAAQEKVINDVTAVRDEVKTEKAKTQKDVGAAGEKVKEEKTKAERQARAAEEKVKAEKEKADKEAKGAEQQAEETKTRAEKNVRGAEKQAEAEKAKGEAAKKDAAEESAEQAQDESEKAAGAAKGKGKGKGKGKAQQAEAIGKQLEHEQQKSVERQARLQEMLKVAQEKGDEKAAARIQSLMDKEQGRYNKKLDKTMTRGGTAPAEGATEAPAE